MGLSRRLWATIVSALALFAFAGLTRAASETPDFHLFDAGGNVDQSRSPVVVSKEWAKLSTAPAADDSTDILTAVEELVAGSRDVIRSRPPTNATEVQQKAFREQQTARLRGLGTPYAGRTFRGRVRVADVIERRPTTRTKRTEELSGGPMPGRLIAVCMIGGPGVLTNEDKQQIAKIKRISKEEQQKIRRLSSGSSSLRVSNVAQKEKRDIAAIEAAARKRGARGVLYLVGDDAKFSAWTRGEFQTVGVVVQSVAVFRQRETTLRAKGVREEETREAEIELVGRIVDAPAAVVTDADASVADRKP